MIIKSHKKLFKEDTFTVENWTVKENKINKIKKKYKNFALQVDGGGILGIIPAYNLYSYYYENKIDFSELIDDYYGTSTGALIVSLLYCGYTPKDVLELYIDYGPTMFNDRSIFGKLFKSSLYRSFAIEVKLKELFGDITLIEAYEKNKKKATLNIAMVDPIAEETIICNHKTHPNMKIKDLCRASTAAPVYFKPHKIDGKIYIDGGAGTYTSLFEKAFDYYRDKKLKPSEFCILSLGCGITKKKLDYSNKNINRILNRSKFKSLIFTFSFGRKETILRQENYINKYINSVKKHNIFRYNPELDSSLLSMDNTNNIDDLLKKCEEYNYA